MNVRLRVPWRDWQFWVVSVAALIAGVMILRAALPARWQPWKKQGKQTRATLTIGGEDARSRSTRKKEQ